MNKLAVGVLIIVTGVAAGCQRPSKGLDYTVYLDHMPASILVLPPVNQSGDKEATKDFMESVSRPLAERGYYVFPVAVVESVMVANGATTPSEMRNVPLEKLEELFGADAILYIDILEWAESYVVVDASTTVRLSYRLVDTRTGTPLWRWASGAKTHTAAISSGWDPLEFLLSAAYSLVAAQVKGASNAASDSEAKLARRLNRAVFENDGFGLLPGPRHPEFEADQARRRSTILTGAGAGP